MSTIHLVGGEKGGVGKSVMARILAQHLIDAGHSFVAVDADTSHGALLRYYADYTQAVDLEHFQSADQILDRALGADRRVLVDLPAQSARKLRQWLDAGEVVGFAREMDVKLVFWHVTDGGYDSVLELSRMREHLGSHVAYVIVKNFGRSHDFSQVDESATFQALTASGATVVELPELDPSTMYRIDRFGSSFWAAVNRAEGEHALLPMERRRAKLWLERCNVALQPAAPLI